VGALVKDVVDLAALPAHVAVEVAGPMPHLRTEKAPLQQVFMNLIGNSVKHGAPRASRIEISATREKGSWAFHVHDNGPGIPAEFHQRIFGLFQTLAPRDRVEGSGIGLAVVKKLVEARGGRVWVESQTGQGARFSFTWKDADGPST
jgi:signal transduction histidine kinase